MAKKWERLLREAVDRKGMKQAAKELGKSPTTIHLVLSGRYGASTRAIEKRVLDIYGNGGVSCPVLGELEPARCAEHYARARKVGIGVGSPETLRLHHACLNCHLRR